MIVSKALLLAHMLHIASFHCRSFSISSRTTTCIARTRINHNIQTRNKVRLLSQVDDASIKNLNNVSLSSDSSSYRYAKKYVMIRKNKQSMAFRNGSPLVYSGSVLKTVQLDGDVENLSNHSLEMGSLVGIMVSNESDQMDFKKGIKRGGKGKGTQATEIKYNHLLVDKINDKVLSYTIDGSLVSSMTGTKETEKELGSSKLIGFGFYNPVSMYRVFIFCHQTAHPHLFQNIRKTINEGRSEIDTTETVLEMVLRIKIKDAARARVLQDLPSTTTDSYRLVNGEGDGLSGLVVDILGGRVAVIMASAAWCELYRETIIRVVDDILKTEHPIYAKEDIHIDIVWRNTPMRLKQDGYILEEEDEEDHNNPKLNGKEATPVVVTENTVKYNTYPFDTSIQKTGFYCDQRDNRFNVAKFCKGKRVLDLCCYNGGFALNAIIHGGATSCIGVDSSPVAIAAAEENKELNGISSSLSFVRMDIEQYMDESFENGNEFDVIVLDPPKVKFCYSIK